MGLAIKYNLWTNELMRVHILRGWLEQTRAFALELGCKDVGPVRKVGPDFIWGRRILTVPRQRGDPTGDRIPLCEVKPRCGYIVEIWPGEGCESAHFGLCQYPRTVRIYGELYRPHFAVGWTFGSSCKTQYAHEHGWKHFLRCHQTIVRLLEFLRGLGMGVAVTDEGGYWETRSEEKLRNNLRQYDGLVAAVGGMFKDAAADDGSGLSVVSPVFDNIRFERLELEGRLEFGRQIEQLQKEIR